VSWVVCERLPRGDGMVGLDQNSQAGGAASQGEGRTVPTAWHLPKEGGGRQAQRTRAMSKGQVPAGAARGLL
jgi:hypothetical protein